MTVNGSAPCVATSDVLLLTIQQSPVADAGSDTYISFGSSAILQGSASGGSGNYSYLWSPSNLVINPEAQNSNTTSLTEDEEFILTVVDLNTGCQASDTVSIILNAANLPPVAMDDYGVTPMDNPITIPVLNNDFDPEGSLSESIELCGGPYNGLVVINNDASITYSPFFGYIGNDSLCYIICDNGVPSQCDTAMVYLTITGEVPERDLVIYNTITPNGDGMNDFWYIKGIEFYTDNDVVIFNRWGDVVSRLEGYNNTTVIWSGTNKRGEELPDGTYFYILKIRLDSVEQTFNGWILIHGYK
jgi:gliding motility-associated-like protein